LGYDTLWLWVQFFIPVLRIGTLKSITFLFASIAFYKQIYKVHASSLAPCSYVEETK
jgi:hypothetical protein